MFTQFLFPDRFSLILIFIFVESISLFCSVFSVTHIDALNIIARKLTEIIPLNSKTLWSVLISTVIEVLKKRWMLIKSFLPKGKSRNVLEMEGMPPAYIVVDIRWDDPEDKLVEDKFENKIEEPKEQTKNIFGIKNDTPFQNYCMTNTYLNTQRYRCWPKTYWHLTIGNCFLDEIYKHQENQDRLCFDNIEGSYISLREALNLTLEGKGDHLLLKKIAVITRLLPVNPLEKFQPSGGADYMWVDNKQEVTSSSKAEHNTDLTKNSQGIWYILAGKFNLFLANSAFGVIVISFAFANVQDKFLETKDHNAKLNRNIWRKVKRKQKVLPALKTNKSHHYSQSNGEDLASGAATTTTQA